MRREQLQRFRRDASPPAGLAEPVSNFGGEALDVGAGDISKPANRFPADVDGKVGLQIRRVDGLQERLRVAEGIWVRKAVAEVPGDVQVVGVADQRGGISGPPPPQRAALSFEDHRI
jgi:hypothetical protein